MGIEATQNTGRKSIVRAVCDTCGFADEIRCDYERHGGGTWKPNVGQANSKLTAQGWAVVKGNLHCPKCEQKRKVVPMKKPQKQEEAPTQPSKTQKREIVLMLTEVYDTDAERYCGGETDDSVASAIGVVPGWVAEIRSEMFGDNGGNDDLAGLREEVGKSQEDCAAAIKDLTDALTKVRKLQAACEAHAKRLDAIEKAVGPRIMKAAKG